MILHFNTLYIASQDETLAIRISLYNNDETTVKEDLILLSLNGNDRWHVTYSPIEFFFSRVTYKYIVLRNGKVVTEEWGIHEWNVVDKREIVFWDAWQEKSECNYLFTSAFSAYMTGDISSQYSFEKKNYTFKVYTLLAYPYATLGLAGNLASLGNWNAQFLIRMNKGHNNEWFYSLELPETEKKIEYKYVWIDQRNGNILEWESGDNRELNRSLYPEEAIWIRNDGNARLSGYNWRGAGVVIPVFSLRTKGSFGVGDFGDLKTMIDWASSVQMKAIQLLPINDTTLSNTWRDSYPYNSISVFALHPMYVDLRQLGCLNNKRLQSFYDQKQQELNALDMVDYEKVNHYKREFLRLFFEQEGDKILKGADFHAFFETNKYWLVPYASFSFLRDKFETSNFEEWPEFSTYHEKQIKSLCESDKEVANEMDYHYFIQFVLFKQMSDVHNYARSKRVLLKGDIPIGISRNSVPAWVDTHYFNFNGQAGAPPDDFSINGQNWGFPTYNWEEMAKDQYRWWRKRFEKMSDYFDAYRIDHVLGFFRIWEVPYHSIHGILGHFEPSLPFTKEELAGFGFNFNEQLYTNPYIDEQVLISLFGDLVELVKKEYLNYTSDNRYVLKKGYDNQRDILTYFSDKIGQQKILDGLLYLTENILFIRDEKCPDKFHPRICGQKTDIYFLLDDNQKRAYNILYDNYYYYRHNQLWADEALKKLPTLISSTRMLACAEDLGMVPLCVKDVLERLQILSLEIQRMPKVYGEQFSNLKLNPYLSVSTISTHDMPPLRNWWEMEKEAASVYYHQILNCKGEAPETIPDYLCERIVYEHLACPSMLCLLALQDWLSIDDTVRIKDIKNEQINDPSNSNQYWRYRMHTTIEDLIGNGVLANRIVSLIEKSKRS